MASGLRAVGVHLRRASGCSYMPVSSSRGFVSFGVFFDGGFSGCGWLLIGLCCVLREGWVSCEGFARL